MAQPFGSWSGVYSKETQGITAEQNLTFHKKGASLESLLSVPGNFITGEHGNGAPAREFAPQLDLYPVPLNRTLALS